MKFTIKIRKKFQVLSEVLIKAKVVARAGFWLVPSESENIARFAF